MGPLAGIRIVELAGIGPGPFAGMLLSDMGADIVRIDRAQQVNPAVFGKPNLEPLYRGRRSIGVDLKNPEGVELVLSLVEKADALFEGYRPGVTERLGLGPDDCRARNPRLVYGRMTGYGQRGPLAAAAGHDINYIALSGALGAIGPRAGKPVPPLNLVGDYGGGALYLAFGLMAALFERQRSGQGQVVDAAMVDGAASLMSIFHGLAAAGTWGAPRGENLLDGGAPFYDTYETADGRHVALGALEPKFFAELVARIGLEPGWVKRQYDRAGWPEMRGAIATAIKAKTREQWCALLEGSDACFAPVLALDEAAAHPHAVAREAYLDVGGVTQPAPAPRFSRSRAGPLRAAPEVGAHSDAVLAEAGFSAAQIAELRAAGVVR